MKFSSVPLTSTSHAAWRKRLNAQLNAARQFAKSNEAHIASRQLSIHLWKHDANSFHLKGIWVDKRYMLLTGNNLNPRAWKLDLENALLVQDHYDHLTEKFEREVENILQNTQLICTYKQLEKLEDYPEVVQKLMRKVTRVKADRVLKQIFLHQPL